MRRMEIFALFGLLGTLLFLVSTSAQNGPAPEIGEQRFEAPFPSGGHLNLEVQSGDIRITGGDENRIRIRYAGTEADQGHNVKVALKAQGAAGDLHIHGGPSGNFQILIEIPRHTHLHVRMPFGSLEVRNTTGNKDIELHSGELVIGIGNPRDYARVEASVYSGELDSPPFGISKGGLFRSFHKEGNGPYTLHAHVGTGELTLQ
ncbi:MAG TPA: hypothetical protein VEG30_10340 [Terriglobales bacterium]|nr:hypothetical protein [Terriglobales bacterium]